MPLFGLGAKKSKKDEEEEETSSDEEEESSSDDSEEEVSSEEEEEEEESEEEESSEEEGEEEESEEESSEEEEEEEESSDEEEDEDEESDEEEDESESGEEESSDDDDDDEEEESEDESKVVVPLPSTKTGKKSKSITAKGKDPKKLAELERKAVAEATATADKAFVPSPSLLDNESPKEVMKQVDGPSLKSYKSKDNVYVGKSVPIPAGSNLVVPITVSMPGSVVEYTVDIKSLDVKFGITAEREEGVTVVKESEKTDPADGIINGKFLVGSVPCDIQFTFENEYSWFRGKVVSYKIIVSPPTKELLISGRQRRAEACLAIVDKDVKAAENELTEKKKSSKELQEQIDSLNKQLKAAEKSMTKLTETEKKVLARLNLRQEQAKLLKKRLKDPEYEEPEEGSKTKSKTKAKKNKK